MSALRNSLARQLTVVAMVGAVASWHRPPSGGAPHASAAGSGTFTILHTNDIHGDLREFLVDTGNATSQTGDPGRTYQQYDKRGMIGGVGRLASAIARFRQARPAGSVLLVDAGDTFGDGLLANLTRGEATIRVMNALGYTFMTLGNHDFEYTTARTAELQSLARFPMRAANAIVKATGAPVLGDPTLIVSVGGVRVGLLAIGYHNTDQTGNKANTRDLAFTNGIEAARRYIPVLRRQADVVVVVSHQGTVVDRVLAERVPGIDLIVGGHSHDIISPPRRIGATWIVEALSDASALGEVEVRVDHGHVASVTGAVHELYAGDYPTDPRVASMVDSMRARFRDTLETVIATAAERIGRRYKSASPIDVLAADILRQAGHADVAFLPGLGFGVTIQPGPITREMLIDLFPHPTSVIRERLLGRQIRAILEQTATNLRPVNELDRVGGMIQTSGLRWTIDLTKPIGRRISNVYVGAGAMDDTASYTVMTNGGLLQGTHRQITFAEGRDIVHDAPSFAVLVENELRRMKTIHAPPIDAVTLIK